MTEWYLIRTILDPLGVWLISKIKLGHVRMWQEVRGGTAIVSILTLTVSTMLMEYLRL